MSSASRLHKADLKIKFNREISLTLWDNSAVSNLCKPSTKKLLIKFNGRVCNTKAPFTLEQSSQLHCQATSSQLSAQQFNRCRFVNTFDLETKRVQICSTSEMPSNEKFLLLALLISKDVGRKLIIMIFEDTAI